VENLEWDTLLGIHVLQPEFPRGLDFLTSIYTDQPYYKHMTKMGDSKSWNSRVAKKTLYEYNGIDCCVTYQVAMKQIEEFKEHDPSLLALFRYEMDMIPVSLHLTESGMLYDMETRDRLNQVVISKFNFAQETLNNIFKRTVNVKSPLLKDLLYGELGLPVRKDPKTGAVTTGEDAIVSLIGYTETKIRESVKEETKMKYKMQQFALRLILLIRGYRTLKSNYIDVELHDDMRCRSSWNIGATETGRWSASKAVDDTGLNAQTFPREVIEYDDEELKVITASVS
jgi:DNA polymerase I-like protein with 3'-5' exonuclease and polymerase domains